MLIIIIILIKMLLLWCVVIISWTIDILSIYIPCVLQRLCGLFPICVHILNKWFLQAVSFLVEVPGFSFSMMIVPREGFQVW